ncbi:MAG: hypothetical protein FWD88_04020 [Treponema sp.]|nr:hypothetical protein [Treponema sp.]
MKIIAIKNIARKNVPIYYRLVYTGVAVIEAVKRTDEHPIDFSIEIKPTGEKEIAVTVNGNLDYPVIPVVKELKTVIGNMHSDGELPD